MSELRALVAEWRRFAVWLDDRRLVARVARWFGRTALPSRVSIAINGMADEVEAALDKAGER